MSSSEPSPWEKEAVKDLRTIRRQLARSRRILNDPTIPDDILFDAALDSIWNTLQELRLSTGIKVERKQRRVSAKQGRSPNS